jgi:hypothetical protein
MVGCVKYKLVTLTVMIAFGTKHPYQNNGINKFVNCFVNTNLAANDILTINLNAGGLKYKFVNLIIVIGFGMKSPYQNNDTMKFVNYL